MKTDSRHFIVSLVYGSLLLAFFLYLILAGPENLSGYKHQLVAIISSLLVGVFGVLLSGSINLGIESPFLESKLGKLAVKATGGVALFILTMLWWKSENPPIKVEEIKEFVKEDGDSTRTMIDGKAKDLEKVIVDDGSQTRDVIVSSSLSELEVMFPFAVRVEGNTDNTIMHLNGEPEIPITSYDNGFELMKLRWGDSFKYYFYKQGNSNPEENSKLSLQLSNGTTLPLSTVNGEHSIRIPGSNPTPITAVILNPDRISEASMKIMIYSSDRDLGREKFKQALLNTSLSDKVREIFMQISSDGVRLRSAPVNSPNTILRTLNQGAMVKVLETSGEFSKIRLPEGKEGWVDSKFIEKIH